MRRNWIEKPNAIVLREVSGLSRRAMPLEVPGRRAREQARGSQWAHDIIEARGHTVSDRAVHSLLQQLNTAVFESYLELKFWVLLEEVRQLRENKESCQCHRHICAQDAADL